MYDIIPLKNKYYYLYDLKENEWAGRFNNYEHVLLYFKNSDLSFLAHNKNDKNIYRNRVCHPDTFLYYWYHITESPKSYIIFDYNMKVVHKDILIKDIEKYSYKLKNEYKRKKRGTNKKRSWRGYRNKIHYYKNTIALLVGDKYLFPLNKRQLSMKDRCWDWDNSLRSNKGDSWKLKKKKKQWN